ncbi:flagellar assembly protein FliH [Haloimpatiens sp. FM7330]
MQSSSNVIKSVSVKKGTEKKIKLNYEIKRVVTEENDDEEQYSNHIDNYENLAKAMIDGARKKSEKLVQKAYTTAYTLEKEAAEKGYSSGYEKGEKAGYEAGYNKAMEDVQNEAKVIIGNAEEILKSSKVEYEKYLNEKSEYIKDLIISTIRDVLMKEIDLEDGVSQIIYEAIRDCKDTKTFIIRCNDIYVEDLKSKIETWKQSMGFKGDMFVLGDNSLKKGIVQIDKDNGKIEIDINNSFEKVKEIIKNS